MVQEQPANQLAGMDPAEISINMREICKEYAVTSKQYAQNMPIYRLYWSNMQKM